MMWNGGYGMGAGGVIWLVLVIAVLALIVVGVVLLVRGLAGNRDHGQSRLPLVPPAPTGRERAAALEILEQRYAQGEIDREEFLQRKADLQS